MPLTTRSDAPGNATSQNLGAYGHDRTKCPHLAGDGIGCDRHELVPILAFLKCEIDQSATVLRDLAGRISRALCTLATAAELGHHQASLSDAAIALQNEDRIQQRLCDLAAAISVLERALAGEAPNAGTGINQAVIESLRLEETRRAFATGVGLADALHQLSTGAEVPSVGDIDLF
jgi:hypothetical protein